MLTLSEIYDRLIENSYMYRIILPNGQTVINSKNITIGVGEELENNHTKYYVYTKQKEHLNHLNSLFRADFNVIVDFMDEAIAY